MAIIELSPVGFSTDCHVFEATAEQLLAAGLIEPEELPGEKPGCKTWFGRPHDGIGCFRLADGRVRLKIRADLVRQRSRAFVGFMAALTLPTVLGDGP